MQCYMQPTASCQQIAIHNIHAHVAHHHAHTNQRGVSASPAPCHAYARSTFQTGGEHACTDTNYTLAIAQHGTHIHPRSPRCKNRRCSSARCECPRALSRTVPTPFLCLQLYTRHLSWPDPRLAPTASGYSPHSPLQPRQKMHIDLLVRAVWLL
jgi:hypothetical protein